MDFHPLSSIFPMMSEREFSDLREDIARYGLREPVWLHQDGRVLDGRNRWLACEELGLTPATRTYEGTDEDLVSFVVSLNLHRRHLSESQRAMVAERLAQLPHGVTAANLPDSLRQAEAAGLLGVSERSVRSARVVRERGVPELAAAVEAGELAVSAAADIARELPETQRERMAHVGRNTGDNEWYTPLPFVEAARATMGGIDLDPASTATANEVVRASQFFDVVANGLEQGWQGRVWMNPPYAQPLVSQFCNKLVVSFMDGAVSQACVLVNNATETVWFQAMARTASAVCFPAGRVKFWHPTKVAAPLQGQAVLYFGHRVGDFVVSFREVGVVLVRDDR